QARRDRVPLSDLAPLPGGATDALAAHTPGAMSRENVELVRAAVGGPVFDMLRMFEGDEIPAEIDVGIFAPDMEIEFQPRVDRQTYSGIDGLVQGWRDWLSAWSRYEAHM